MSCLHWKDSDVVLGPSADTNICALKISSQAAPDEFDDYLTEEEIDFICGTYFPLTGSFSAMGPGLSVTLRLGAYLRTPLPSCSPACGCRVVRRRASPSVR